MNFLKRVKNDEAFRRDQFPTATDHIYMAHAGVAPLPRVAADAMRTFLDRSQVDNPESDWALECVERAREDAARLIGAGADEIALLGPTSVGLSLVANGLAWEPGDEVVSYFEDYPANVYPWTQLAHRGVDYVSLQPEIAGVITWDDVEPALTERTRLVSLASCHFLTGYRIDLDVIGQRLHERGVLFCVDGIQTLGVFPSSVEHVDFLSADSHKWMLGPPTAGIFYVKRALQEQLRPTLVGAMNLETPDFIAQENAALVPGARRYEPGIQNLANVVGMRASLDMLLGIGVEAISERVLELKNALVEGLEAIGYIVHPGDRDRSPGAESAILSVSHPEKDAEQVYEHLRSLGVVTSHRRTRNGDEYVRLSPHFYNTLDEIDRVVELMR